MTIGKRQTKPGRPLVWTLLVSSTLFLISFLVFAGSTALVIFTSIAATPSSSTGEMSPTGQVVVATVAISGLLGAVAALITAISGLLLAIAKLRDLKQARIQEGRAIRTDSGKFKLVERYWNGSLEMPIQRDVELLTDGKVWWVVTRMGGLVGQPHLSV